MVGAPLGFEITLSRPPADALERVAAALKAEGFGILTKIDVRETLKQKLGIDFRPYFILGACNPALAHRALERRADVGLLLPCNITVEANDAGGTIVRIGDPDSFMALGDMAADSVIRGVAQDARARLERVAAGLASG
jgi:uncharacterized protein (DUF302 family)